MNTLPIEVSSGRINPHVDPTMHIWCWDVAAYLFLGGIAAGLLVIHSLLAVRRSGKAFSWPMQLAPLGALAALSLGMFFLFLDLEAKNRVYRFYMAFRFSSPMSWGSWVLLITYPVGLLLALGGWSEEQKARILGPGLGAKLAALVAIADRRRDTLLKLGLVTGVGLGIYTGLLLGTLSARIQWNTAILGPLFLVSGISTGAACLLLLPINHDEHRRLTRWDVNAIVLELCLIGVMLLGMATGGEAAQYAAWNLLGGPATAEFWSLIVIMGLSVPLVLELLELRQKRAPIAIAPLLVLGGGLALRYIILHAGQDTSYDALLAKMLN